MLANYHTHTYRCQHASGSDREYVEAAIESGIKILGFSDHCPWVFPRKDFVSTMRMAPADVDGYFSNLERLKKEYEKDIKIYIGFECEHCPNLLEAQECFLADYPMDYRIMGQHFLGAEYESHYTGRRHENEELLRAYVDTVIDGINSGKYLYVAHPDLIYYIGPEEIYEEHMERLCVALKEADMPVEINLLGLSERRHYPERRFLKIAGKTGNKAILGVDAHAPKQLRNEEVFRKGEQLCHEHGLAIVDRDMVK